MSCKELETIYGRTIKPKELASFLELDTHVVVKYADRWGGVEVVPGTFKFFEKVVMGVLNVKQDTGEKSLDVPSKVVNRSKLTADTILPTICFYSDGDYWHIGELGEEKLFKKRNGFSLIHFLVGRPQEQIASEELEHLGKVSKEDLGRINKGETFIYTDKVSAAIAEKSQTKLKVMIEYLKERIENGENENPDDVIDMKNNIKMIKQSLNNKNNRDYKSESEKARTRVYKNIRNACNVIIKEVPMLELYLNRGTIVTGYDCYYNPLPDNKPRWVLYKKERHLLDL